LYGRIKNLIFDILLFIPAWANWFAIANTTMPDKLA
jgi:hypothetical protein